MSLLWVHAMIPDGAWYRPPGESDDDVFRPEDHDEHRMSHLLRSAGWGESPCTNISCPDFDEKHNDAMDRAYDAKGEVQTHPPTTRLHGFEVHMNPYAAIHYMNHPEGRSSRPPKVFTYRGDMHVLDGHHRLLADQAAGRPLVFEHVDLDREDA